MKASLTKRCHRKPTDEPTKMKMMKKKKKKKKKESSVVVDANVSMTIVTNPSPVAVKKRKRVGKNKEHAIEAATDATTTLRSDMSVIKDLPVPHVDAGGFADGFATAAAALYGQLSQSSGIENTQRTVLAAVLLRLVTNGKEDTACTRIVSLGTGTKVLAVQSDTKSDSNTLLTDMHAEVLARRGLLRFLVDELIKCYSNTGVDSDVFRMEYSDGVHGQQQQRAVLRHGVSFHLYISSSPCGSAKNYIPSTPVRSRQWNNEHGSRSSMLTISKHSPCVVNVLTDGRVGWVEARLSSDIAPGKVSCSDKLCLWNAIGLQGAALSVFIKEPIRFTSIVVGHDFHLHSIANALCCRAGTDIQHGYHPVLLHTRVLFGSSKTGRNIAWSKVVLVWNAADVAPELIKAVTGLVPALRYPFTHLPSLLSRKCRLDQLKLLYINTTKATASEVTWKEIKNAATDYQCAKNAFLLLPSMAHWPRRRDSSL